MQVPVGLQTHPQLRRRLQQSCEPERRIGRYSPLPEDDFIESVERNAKSLRRFELTQTQRLQVLLQRFLARRDRRPQPIRISSDSLRRGLRRHVPSPTET